ncbi:MAG: metallophosphoesterase [Anaerolineae bacterium]|nr:metallophosphoesterase [Anaerolineae bacterium]
MQPLLTYVQISDTHIGPTRDFQLDGSPTFPYLERLVCIINSLPAQPDFVIHTGDIANEPDAESYRVAASLFSRLRAPVYYLCGNHDRPDMIRQYMAMLLNISDVPAGAPLCYAFEVEGEHFLALDTSEPSIDPRGRLGDDQLERLHAECTPDGPPLTVFMHHPPFPVNSPWADRNLLLENGEAVHQALLPARERLRGVFFGHLHRSCQFVRDGITYTGASSTTASQMVWMPWEDFYIDKVNSLPSYNITQYFSDYVHSTQYTFTF